MAIYTVHAPPDGALDAAGAARIRFIRDGFAFWALVLPGAWFLWNRLWLAFLGWLAAMIAFELLGRSVGETTAGVAALLFGVFLALEARDIQRWTLERRGWRMLGVVEGSDLEVAERRFFEAWLSPAAEDAAASSADGTGAVPAEPAAPPSSFSPSPSSSPPPASSREAAGQGIARGPRPTATGVIGLFPESGGRG